MKILLLYDRNATQDEGVNWLSLLLNSISSKYDVQSMLLDKRKIKPCIGCFGCWTKTPGRCVLSDQANDISQVFMQADAVIILTKMTYGGYSSDVKAFLDRAICNLSPFFTMIRGEMHHKKRYESYPDLIALAYGDRSKGEQETFARLVERNALNLHSKRSLALMLGKGRDTNRAFSILNYFLGGGRS